MASLVGPQQQWSVECSLGFGGAVRDQERCRSWSPLQVGDEHGAEQTRPRLTFCVADCCVSVFSFFRRTVGTDGCGREP